MQALSDLPPVGGRHGAHRGFEPLVRFGRRQHDDLSTFARAPARKAEAQKMHRPRLAHATLLLVDLEPHAPLEEIADRGHDALVRLARCARRYCNRRRSEQTGGRAAPTPSPTRRARCWTGAATAGRPCGVPSWTSIFIPSGITTPAFSIRRTRARMRGSLTLWAIRSIRR